MTGAWLGLPQLSRSHPLPTAPRAVRGDIPYSYQSFILYDPVIACFAGRPMKGTGPDSGCTQVRVPAAGAGAGAAAVLVCAGLITTPTHPPLSPRPREQLSIVRTQLAAIGIDTRNMGFYAENHDTDRFLSIR